MERRGKCIDIFIGPEGAGKSTLAKRLAKESGRPYITTGDIIRDLAANDAGPLGDECREMFEKHSYLNGASLLKIVKNRFGKDDVSSGLILDGGLRTIEETENFPKMLAELGLALPVVVFYLQIPEKMTYERLVEGPHARKRGDDTVEAVKTRLEMFNLNLSGRLDLIKNQSNWSLVEIDATGEVDEVYGQVRLAMKN